MAPGFRGLTHHSRMGLAEQSNFRNDIQGASGESVSVNHISPPSLYPFQPLAYKIRLTTLNASPLLNAI